MLYDIVGEMSGHSTREIDKIRMQLSPEKTKLARINNVPENNKHL